MKIAFEAEQNKNNSHIAEWLKSIYDATLVRIQCESFLFSVLSVTFCIDFCKKFFCLGAEVPSWDLDGDGGN